MRLRRIPLAVLLAVALAGFAALAPLRTRAAADADTLIASAFNSAYNLDLDPALSSARQAVAAAPQSSRAHRSLASVLWLRTLFLRGAMTVDHYMSGMTRSDVDMVKPPAEIDAEFRTAIGRAIELAEAARKVRPRDPMAIHELGLAYGVQASWTASIEGRVMAAFSSARRAFDFEETVLEQDPQRVSAGVVVGSYRYAIATMGMTSRMLAYMAGFGGDKDRALALLESGARSSESQFEARGALAVIYSREGRHRDAFAVLGQMAADFPRNRLLVLEQGAAAIRSGRAAEADVLLTRGLAALDRDDRVKMPGERALWLYKRGLARMNRNNRTDAAADFGSSVAAGPESWVRARLHLEYGKLADVAGKRQEALVQYRTAKQVGEKANDPICVANADRYIRRPFVMGGSTR